MAAPTVASTTITEPGVYDLPEAVYHADPVPEGSLSSSGARKLLPPSCPARFRYEQQHPPESTRAMDLGHAAHKQLLGVGDELEVVNAADWRTKDARAKRDEARARGAVPLLAHEWEQVEEMAEVLRCHPVAGRLFDPDCGSPEQSLFWIDQPTGVWRRARLDWLPDPVGPGKRMILGEYKTTRSADLDQLSRAVHSYGYHQQAAWYSDAVKALGHADDVAFVFVFQEKEPPYLVTVAELDSAALRIGARLNRQALDIYRSCRDSGHWPDYSHGEVQLLSLPHWVENRYLEEAS